ncbi:hypothetical protein GNI_016520 [Gregarina niphandrodes]|uniref:Uncharacterized protein n=1 Tax=Gregarina niphandrodes TaxID=110365 RepID=A0A023BCA1_GRENI|nr:hypothetical protein GNI_016520 [Gregarina niphandrodes]EZG82427.1 hypothetical protein GNI_016520 [Gregarina niphandrodes]|eukprot:XP_011128996.1 hypothetical protein GNI_016520 [Gregarina niphandrodes]
MRTLETGYGFATVMCKLAFLLPGQNARDPGFWQEVEDIIRFEPEEEVLEEEVLGVGRFARAIWLDDFSASCIQAEENRIAAAGHDFGTVCDDSDLSALGRWFEHQRRRLDKMPEPSELLFLTRRTVEEYEQWDQAANLEVRNWIDPKTAGLSKDSMALTLLITYGMLYRDNYARAGHSFEATPPGPSLIRWAWYTWEEDNMQLEKRLKTLALLSRWSSMKALSGLLRQPPGSSYSLQKVTKEACQAAAAFWFCPGDCQREKGVDEVVDAVVEDVMQGRSVFEAAQRREQLLSKQYMDAYQRCQYQFLSVYFPGAPDFACDSRQPFEERISIDAPQFPVGSETKINCIDDYGNYNLRQWAWFEEELVRSLLKSFLCELSQSELKTVNDMMGRSEWITISMNQEDFDDRYNEVLKHVVRRVAHTQAEEYAHRLSCVQMTVTQKSLHQAAKVSLDPLPTTTAPADKALPPDSLWSRVYSEHIAKQIENKQFFVEEREVSGEP